MPSARNESSLRVSVLACVAAAVVCVALIGRQLEKRSVFAMMNLGQFSERSVYGWPFMHLELTETRPVGSTLSGPEAEEYRVWRGWQLLANCVLSLFLIVSTVFVCGMWVRSERPLQFSVRQVLAFTAVVAVIMAFGREQVVPYDDNGNILLAWSLVSWRDLGLPYRWPVLLGIACSIYFLIWVTCVSGQWMVRLVVATEIGWRLVQKLKMMRLVQK